MFPIAIFGLLAGGWLIDSAVHKRNPFTSALDIIRDPSSARQIVANAGNSEQYIVQRNQGTGVNTQPRTDGRADGTVTSDNLNGGSAGAAGSSIAQTAIAYARAQIGKPYGWGKTGPESFDCSGLVMKAYEAAGVSLPRTTATMAAAATAGTSLKWIKRAELQAGDLVFPDAGHVQIWTGVGTIVEAPRAGLKVREVQPWGFWRCARPTYRATGTGGTARNQTR